MGNTPRTDALCRSHEARARDAQQRDDQMVYFGEKVAQIMELRTHARKLERELAATNRLRDDSGEPNTVEHHATHTERCDVLIATRKLHHYCKERAEAAEQNALSSNAIVKIAEKWCPNAPLSCISAIEEVIAKQNAAPQEATQHGNGSLVDHAPAVAALFRFYAVDTLDALVEAQARHVEKLQAKLPPMQDTQSGKVREG